ncbi:MAG: MFS transporter [Myxococcota bacterium]
MPGFATLCLVWYFILGGLGLFFPFYSLYLRENVGLSGAQTGMVMAIPPLLGIFVQPFWGQIADRSGSRTRVLALLALGASIGYTALLVPHSFAGFVVGTAALAIFGVALIPTAVSASLALLQTSGGRAFGRARVFGTLGFAVSVGGFPLLLNRIQARAPPTGSLASTAEPYLELIFPLAGGMLLLGGLLALMLPKTGTVALRAKRGDWRELLHHGPFLRLLVVTFFAFLFLQGPMALFPILVRGLGGGIDSLSRMWLVMLAIEIPLVTFVGASVARLGLRGVIATGVAAGALRWLVSGFADSLLVVTLIQFLHGVVVWGVILGTPLYVDAVVPDRLRSTGQGLLAMIGVSIGGLLSNVCAGWLIDQLGPRAPAQVGGCGALLLLGLLFWILPTLPNRDPSTEPTLTSPARSTT